MFGRMCFVNNLLFCVLLGQVTAERITETEARMFDLFNGNYDNSAQGAGPNSRQDLIKVIVCPVLVGAKPLIYIFEAVNGELKRVHFKSVEETSPGVITMETYNITRPSLYKEPPHFFNRTEIENIRLDETEFVVGCRTQFEFDTGCFVGGWEDCKDTINRKYTIYELTIFCDKFNFITPAASLEKFSLAPYDMMRVSDKYQLINAPENFTSFCDNQNAKVNQ